MKKKIGDRRGSVRKLAKICDIVKPKKVTEIIPQLKISGSGDDD
jgi:hypothetical protein